MSSSTEHFALTLEQAKTKLLPVPFFTLPLKNPEDEPIGNGDVDYVTTLCTSIGDLMQCDITSHYFKYVKDEQSVYQNIDGVLDTLYKKQEAEASTQLKPILHIFINEPRTCGVYTREGLQQFKEKGGFVVVTVIEFRKYYDAKDANRRNTILRLMDADQILFLDKPDKLDALRYVTLTPEFQDNNHLRQKLLSASIISVPATIMPPATYTKKGNHIIVPGMIRVGKGYQQVVALARLFKSVKDHEDSEVPEDSKALVEPIKPKMNQYKIFVAGTVQEHDASNKELHYLMEALYPSKASEINASSISQLKALLRTYQTLEKEKKLIADLPMEILIDLSETELSLVFSQCDYAFLPAFRGATLRNSSFCTSLAHDMIIISHEGNITDPRLLRDGQYNHAMLFIGHFFGQYPQYYAASAFDLIKHYETVALDKAKIKENARRLFEEVIHPRKIAREHSIVYKAVVIKNLMPNLVPNTDSMASENQEMGEAYRLAHQDITKRLFKKLQNHLQKKKSSEIIDSIFGRDLDSLCHVALMHLNEKLRNQGKEVDTGFPAEMGDYLNKNRKKKAMLTPLERSIVRKGLDLDWYYQSMTTNINAIVNSEGQLRSQAERKRRNEHVSISHTEAREAHQNSLFFSYGVGDDTHAVQFAFAEQHKTRIKIKSSDIASHIMYGQWISDCMYAYYYELITRPVNIFGCKYWTQYKKTLDEKTGKTIYKKIRHFVHPDGKRYQEEVFRGNEFFMAPFIEQSMMHIIVKILRYMPVSVMESVARLDQQQLTNLIQILLGKFSFELHKPGTLSIYEIGVTVGDRPSVPPPLMLKQKETDKNNNVMFNKLAAVIRDALMGEYDKVMSWVKSNQEESEETIYRPITLGQNTLDLFSAAILGGNPKLVSALSQHAPRFPYHYETILLIENTLLTLDPICLALLLSNPKLIQQVLLSIFGDLNTKDTKTREEDYRIIIDLLLNQGVAFKKNCPYRSLFYGNIIYIQWLVQYCVRNPIDIKAFEQVIGSDTFSVRNYPFDMDNAALCWAITTGSIPMVANLLARGFNVNARIKTNAFTPEEAQHKLAIGLTPLLTAIGFVKGSLSSPMVEFLLSQKADIEQAFHNNIRDRQLSKIALYDNATPLLAAVLFGNIQAVSHLLKAKANVAAQNCYGHTALSTAKSRNYFDLVNTMQNYTNVPSVTLKTQRRPFLFHENTQYFILTGVNATKGRFFVCLRDKRDQVFPFDCFGPLISPKDWLKEVSDLYCLGLSINSANFYTLDNLDEEIVSEKIYYKTQITFADIGNCNEAFFKRAALFAHNYLFLYQKDIPLLKFFSSEPGVDLDFGVLEMHGIRFHPFVSQLLSVLHHVKDFSEFFKASEDNCLQSYALSIGSLQHCYREWRAASLRLLEYARTGNIKGIDKLFKTRLFSLDTPIPTSKNYLETKTSSEKNVLYFASAFQVALLEEQYQAVLDIIKLQREIRSSGYFDEVLGSLHLAKFSPFVLSEDSIAKIIKQNLKKQQIYYVLHFNKIIKVSIQHLICAIQFNIQDPIFIKFLCQKLKWKGISKAEKAELLNTVLKYKRYEIYRNLFNSFYENYEGAKDKIIPHHFCKAVVEKDDRLLHILLAKLRYEEEPIIDALQQFVYEGSCDNILFLCQELYDSNCVVFFGLLLLEHYADPNSNFSKNLDQFNQAKELISIMIKNILSKDMLKFKRSLLRNLLERAVQRKDDDLILHLQTVFEDPEINLVLNTRENGQVHLHFAFRNLENNADTMLREIRCNRDVNVAADSKDNKAKVG